MWVYLVERERERERKSSCECPCLVHGYENSCCMMLICPSHTLSFSLFVSVSMLSACQAQLRGLEGNITALQSDLLWQYLALLFMHKHIHKRTDCNIHAYSCQLTGKLSNSVGGVQLGEGREEAEAEMDVWKKG